MHGLIGFFFLLGSNYIIFFFFYCNSKHLEEKKIYMSRDLGNALPQELQNEIGDDNISSNGSSSKSSPGSAYIVSM